MTKKYLVQKICSCCCERLHINTIHFGSNEDKALDEYVKAIEEFKEGMSDNYDEEELDLLIDETNTYFEYCNDDGDNVVIMIEELEEEIENEKDDNNNK